MVIKSAKNTSNVKQSNGNYEVDDIIFASRFVFRTIKSIDKNLRLLYTPGSDSNDWETIPFSPVRDNDEEFDAILIKVEEWIGKIIAFYRSTKKILFKEKRGDAFFKTI